MVSFRKLKKQFLKEAFSEKHNCFRRFTLHFVKDIIKADEQTTKLFIDYLVIAKVLLEHKADKFLLFEETYEFDPDFLKERHPKYNSPKNKCNELTYLEGKQYFKSGYNNIVVGLVNLLTGLWMMVRGYNLYRKNYKNKNVVVCETAWSAKDGVDIEYHFPTMKNNVNKVKDKYGLDLDRSGHHKDGNNTELAYTIGTVDPTVYQPKVNRESCKPY